MNSTQTITGYEIRVKEQLDPRWHDWFEGWSITHLENGEVALRSFKVDQAGVHGTLNKIRDLNLTLISVFMIQKAEIQ
jgi:hypothetical protein